jgi:hypothetical protein
MSKSERVHCFPAAARRAVSADIVVAAVLLLLALEPAPVPAADSSSCVAVEEALAGDVTIAIEDDEEDEKEGTAAL